MQHNQLLTYSDNTTSAHVFCMNAVPLPIIPFRHLSPFRWGVCTTASLFPLESHWHLCTSQFTCNANTQFQWRKFICHNRNLPSTTPQTFLFFSTVQYFCKTTSCFFFLAVQQHQATSTFASDVLQITFFFWSHVSGEDSTIPLSLGVMCSPKDFYRTYCQSLMYGCKSDVNLKWICCKCDYVWGPGVRDHRCIKADRFAHFFLQHLRKCHDAPLPPHINTHFSSSSLFLRSALGSDWLTACCVLSPSSRWPRRQVTRLAWATAWSCDF